MKNITNNNSIIENKSIVENKVKLNTLTKYRSRKILFRLNINKSKEALRIFEKAKYSLNLEEAFKNSYRKIDIDYDTNTLDRVKNRKYLNTIVDTSLYLIKENKAKYLDLINDNKEFIKNNKVAKEVIENNKYFEDKINSL